MYKIIIIAFLSALFVQSESTISWKYGYRINWDDFKAKPQTRTDVIAVTASGLSFQYSTKRYSTGRLDYDFEVLAHFYPDKSWYIKDHVTEVTLAHERLHFDITELHARKFRERVKSTKFTSNIDNEMEAIHNSINDQLSKMQRLYDKETDHSRDVIKQMAWQKYIEEALVALDYYEE